MKRTILVLAFIYISTCLWAQNSLNSQANIAYRNAKNAFENMEYGKALKYAEDAILLRKEQGAKDYNTIQTSLAARDVKKAGDNINSIIPVLTERDEYDCISLINYYNSKGDFDNSISKVLSYIQSQEQFPEAQKLIGDIYKLEGEYDFAEEYYLKALENSVVLDIPDERYEIIYMLADLSRQKGDYDNMEIRLLNIIGKEENEQITILGRSMKNTISRDNDSAVEKYFQMYRSEHYYSLKAYYALAEYYLSLGQMDKAFTYSAIGVITGFTKIYNVISKRDIDFEYTDISSFLDLIPNYSDIVTWGNNNDVWKSFNLFSSICTECGYKNAGNCLLNIRALHSPQKFWQQDAVLRLDKTDGIKNPE
jgi:tetratricopeptide (TPR) repeat protein